MGDRMRIIGLESKTIIFEMGIDLEDIRIVEDGQEYYSLPLGISLIEKQAYDIGYYEGTVACVKALIHSLRISMDKAMDCLMLKEHDKIIIAAMCTKKYRIDFNPVKAIKDMADENREWGYKAAIKFHAKTIKDSKKITEEVAWDILETIGEKKR